MTHKALRPILLKQPQLPYKYLRTNYLAANLDRTRKAEVLAFHYAYLAHIMPAARLRRLPTGGLRVWAGADAAATHSIVLKLANPVDYEGELALEYRVNDTPVHNLSFSFAPAAAFGADGDAVVLVTRIQAMTGDVNLLRTIAKENHDLAPRYVLAAALQGMTLALQHPAIVAVSHENQVTLKGDAKALHRLNYDEFYQSLSAGCSATGGFFTLAVPFPEKDLSLIAQSHRRRTRQKRAIRQAISTQAEHALAALLRGLHGDAAVEAHEAAGEAGQLQTAR